MPLYKATSLSIRISMTAKLFDQDLQPGQKVRLKDGSVLTFDRKTASETYPLRFTCDNNQNWCFTKDGALYLTQQTDQDIVEILPMEEPHTPSTPETVTESTNPTPETVNAVPAPTTMQDLFNAALAELSVSDQQIVQEHIKNRLIEVQRLRTLLNKAERELNDFMAQPLEEAILRLTRQSSYTGMRFRAVNAPKSVAELSGYGS